MRDILFILFVSLIPTVPHSAQTSAAIISVAQTIPKIDFNKQDFAPKEVDLVSKGRNLRIAFERLESKLDAGINVKSVQSVKKCSFP